MTYHVTLAGQGLLLDLQSYRRSLAEPFAGKSARGDLSYGDLRDELVVLIDDWSGGEGFTRHAPDEPARYRSGPALDIAGEPGALRQGPHLTNLAVAAANPGPMPVRAALGKLYWGADGGKLKSYDGASVVTAATLATGGNIAAMVEYEGFLYLGKTGNGSIARWDGTILTDAFVTLPAPVTACHSMGVFYRGSVGYLYLVGDAPDGCRVYYTDGFALSGLRFRMTEPSCRVQPQVIGTTALFCGTWLGSGARTAVYQLRDSAGSEEWRFATTVEGASLLCGAVLGDAAYLAGQRGQVVYPVVYRWRDGAVEPLAHPLPSPYLGGALTAMATWREGVWLAYGESAASFAVKRYDGQAWSEPIAAAWGGGAPLGLGAWGGDLWLGSYDGASWFMARVRADQYAAVATLETGLIDARLPGISKVWRSVTVGHAALLSGQSVQVQYRLEGAGAWTSLGTSATVGATSATFTFPSATLARLIAFRVVLSGAAGATAPVRVLSLEARCRPVPGAKRVWQFDCLIEGSAQMPMVRLDGSNEPLTAVQLSAALWGLAGQAGPLTFVDLDGVSRGVWLLEYEEKGAKMSQRLGTQLRGALRLLEA